MFGIGMTELLVILIVALIVFGPTKLPELARSLGKAMNEFRRASSDLRASFQESVEPPSPPGAPTSPAIAAPPPAAASEPANAPADAPREQATSEAASGGSGTDPAHG